MGLGLQLGFAENRSRPLSCACMSRWSGITLPNTVLRQSPNISAHRQEKLFEAIRQQMPGPYRCNPVLYSV